ncbi:MAG TPA: recombinase RecT, partial [Steroidobacteraceae bacterium]|nr:recombinase RecT [Steroidobacteraceae bacterium]
MSTQEPGQAVDVKMPPPPPQRTAVTVGDRGLRIQSLDELARVSAMVKASGFAPKDFDTPEKVGTAILYAMELGLNPITALGQIAVVNGRPTLWGQAPLALVRASGLLKSCNEFFVDGAGNRVASAGIASAMKKGELTAVCRVWRVGEEEPTEAFFSVADAQRAGLWGKQGPWAQYPTDMLGYKARARALRGTFADVLRGVAIKEDLEGHGPVDVPAYGPLKGNSA